MVLVNAWNQPPRPIPLPDALDVFLVHLQADRVPTNTTQDSVRFSAAPNLAFSCMLGIGKMGQVLPEDGPDVRRIADAWPAIFKWSVYIFTTRVETLDVSDMRRRSAIDVLSTLWYTLAYRDVLRALMVETPKTIEIATRLWLEEHDGNGPTLVNIPIGTSLLQEIIRNATTETLDRIIAIDWAAEGLCAECVRDKTKEWRAEQRDMWARLDDWLR